MQWFHGDITGSLTRMGTCSPCPRVTTTPSLGCYHLQAGCLKLNHCICLVVIVITSVFVFVVVVVCCCYCCCVFCLSYRVDTSSYSAGVYGVTQESQLWISHQFVNLPDHVSIGENNIITNHGEEPTEEDEN